MLKDFHPYGNATMTSESTLVILAMKKMSLILRKEQVLNKKVFKGLSVH